jgi:hypothetical protein
MPEMVLNLLSLYVRKHNIECTYLSYVIFQGIEDLIDYTPRNEVVGGYTGFTMSVRPSVDKSYVVR